MNVCRSVARALAPLVFGTSALVAQTTASLTGMVTVESHPVKGVVVTIESGALQGTRTATTTASGAYLFAALPPGEYAVRFEGPALVPLTRAARLQLAQTSRVDVAMRPSAAETITVNSSVERAAVSTVLALSEIETLPVQRNQLATALLAPGVAGGLTNGQVQISGAPGYDSIAMIDGVVVNENTRGQMRPMYVEDAIQETTVLTGAISAEYGRFTGGVISTITRSGGNEMSGTLRDSLSNPAWSAATPANEARESSLSHVWEGTLGGSMVRDRLWYFAAGRWAKNDTARQTIAVPAFNGGEATPASPQLSYLESNDQKRYEAKVTAQPAERHGLTASYFAIDTHVENARASNNIYDEASLTERNDPDSLLTLRYDFLGSGNWLLTARAARRDMTLESGAISTDLVEGTLLFDRANGNARFNAPALCAVCGAEERDNSQAAIEGQWFAGTRRFGAHGLVAGVERFEERRAPAGHETASDFGLFVTRAQWKNGRIYPVITPTTATGGGTFIRWMPLLSEPRANRLRTDSIYVNDRWDLSRYWRLSAGARFDRNDAVDADGTAISAAGRVSPRLALHYDALGDGRHRFTASLGDYTSRIADTIASSNQSAGAAASIDFAYRGPAINNGALSVPTADAIRMVFEYFNATQGGTANTAPPNLRPNGTRSIPGFATYTDGTLGSPFVRELTLGYAVQLGARGSASVDFLNRDWRDVYSASVTPATRRTTTPLGIPVDLVLLRNSDRLQRTYRAVQVQTRWLFSRFDAGAFYTWSRLRGNYEGESANAGAVAEADPSAYYAGFLEYDRFAPVGWLRGDQRHRLRAWAGADIWRLRVSILQSYDSGLPYSASAPINTTSYSGAPQNPGYASIPNGIYFVSDRGEFRTDDVWSTDLAVRYTKRIAAAELFAQGELLNAFNRSAVADPQRISTSISTAATANGLQPFNPFTTTPQAGTHYQLAANFGEPLNDLAFQRPRTLRVAVGLRF
jgi:hypothetical protein